VKGALRDPLVLWLAAGWLALIGLPWYAVEAGFWSFEWVGSFAGPDAAPALIQAVLHDRPYLWPVILAFVPPLLVPGRGRTDPAAADGISPGLKHFSAQPIRSPAWATARSSQPRPSCSCSPPASPAAG
jgi:hypothetical protein